MSSSTATREKPAMTAEDMKRRRKRLKMTQGEFADHLKTSVRNVEGWEADAKVIPSWVANTLKLLDKIAKLEDKDGADI